MLLRCLQVPQKWPKIDPKWNQNGPKMEPKWSQNGPEMEPKPSPEASKSQHTSRYRKSDPKFTKIRPNLLKNKPKLDKTNKNQWNSIKKYRNSWHSAVFSWMLFWSIFGIQNRRGSPDDQGNRWGNQWMMRCKEVKISQKNCFSRFFVGRPK